ncbi:MAG: hypothetical protein HY645_11445 [Acidobacteria bacterium]|nr:hypothetical protein [Acidobacteriota bacterium]
MRRQILFINLLLLAAVILLSSYLNSAWREFQEQNHPSKTAAGNALESTPPTFAVPGMEQPGSFSDFAVVADKNLFTPERRPESSIPAAQAPQPPPLPIKPVLRGISTVKGKKQAFLNIFEGGNTQGQARTVTVGDVVQGYTVAEISDTGLELRWNDHVIPIDISAAPQPQAAAAPGRTMAAVTIITVGAPAAAVEVAKSQQPGADSQERGLQISSVSGPAGTVGAGARGGAIPRPAGGGQTSPSPTDLRALPGTVGIPGNPQTIQTPFGTIQRQQ